MRLRRDPTLVLALLAACAVVAGCGDEGGPANRETGAVQVSVTLEGGSPESIGGTGYRVRLLGVDGSIHDREIAWPGGAGEPIALPVGAYRAEIWTVYYSDSFTCEVYRTAPGGQRCTSDESADRRCAVDVVVGPGTVSVTYRSGALDWDCSFDGPAAT